jgi:spore coat protein U-like protein
MVAALFLLPSTAEAGCQVLASGVAFGVYNPESGSSTDATGLVTLHCSSDLGDSPYVISLSAGGGTYAGRLLHSGSFNLRYQLYLDAAHGRVWGDGGSGTSVVQGAIPRDGRMLFYPVYGRIPAGVAIAPGAYADRIVMTVSF